MKQVAAWIVWCLMAGTALAESPNIVFILVDDLGWSDLACYGQPWHRTPNIDQIAKQGVQFTDAYASAPICSASRASILTGKTTARLGFEFVTKNTPGHQAIDGPTLLKAPPYTMNLPLEEETIAELLSTEGYETAFFGKWHLNQHYRRYLGWSPTHGPQQQGFQFAEEDFGAHPYVWKKTPPPSIDQEGEFPDDSMVDRVCKYIRRDHDRPFFVMASSFYVHTPVRNQTAWLLDYYDATIPTGEVNRTKRIEYAAFLETLDHHVGQIMKAVDESDQADNTLVVFFSDNGGHPEYTTNAPLRGSKWNLYEGGIRIPMLARWPGKITPGITSRQPVVGYDLLSGFLSVAGNTNIATDGAAIAWESLESESSADRDLLWHFPYYHPETGYAAASQSIGIGDFEVSQTRPQSALRSGRYKLLWFAEDDRCELYDLQNDLGEQHDLSHDLPEKTATLKARLKEMLREQHARLATPR
ncbi:sulfatase [Bremerella cremea]|uniref:sulfatase n=1 Tax=Bremerella cremea TaxID=1031537 RepID=UPI0031E50164